MKKSELVQIQKDIRAARALIASNPLCVGVVARDEYGVPADTNSPEARRWCPVGAITAVVLRTGRNQRSLHFDIFREALGGQHLALWHDKQRSKKASVAMFDKVIKHLQLKIAKK